MKKTIGILRPVSQLMSLIIVLASSLACVPPTVPIYDFNCSTCQSVVLKAPADPTGTLSHALDLLDTNYPNLSPDARLEFIYGEMVDMSGKVPDGQYSRWFILMSNPVTLGVTEFTVKNDQISSHSRGFSTLEDFTSHVNNSSAIRGISRINQLYTEVVDLPLADTPAIMNKVVNDPSYEASGFSIDAILYVANVPSLVVNYYDAEREDVNGDPVDIASIVAYHGGGIRVVVPNENNWVIQGFEPDHYLIEDLSPAEIEDQFHGVVPSQAYFASRKVYNYTLQGN